MLNKWFHGSVGFNNGVRASAALNAGLLLLANVLMKPRLAPTTMPRKEGSTIGDLRTFLRDLPYVVMVLG